MLLENNAIILRVRRRPHTRAVCRWSLPSHSTLQANANNYEHQMLDTSQIITYRLTTSVKTEEHYQSQKQTDLLKQVL